MTTTEPALPPEQLMIELCNLLRQVLGQTSQADQENHFSELMAEISAIRNAMEQHSSALARLVPNATTGDQILQQQRETLILLKRLRQDTDLIL